MLSGEELQYDNDCASDSSKQGQRTCVADTDSFPVPECEDKSSTCIVEEESESDCGLNSNKIGQSACGTDIHSDPEVRMWKWTTPPKIFWMG